MNDTYLALFLGSKTGPRMKAWMALPEAERRAKEQEGMTARNAWVEKHHAAAERGIEDVNNEIAPSWS
jgi:hypothetical protein